MNYWVLSPNVYDNNTQNDWKKAIQSTKRAFIGYNTDHPFGLAFNRDIQIGDIILIAQGQNSAKRFFLCGVVVSTANWETVKGTPGIAQNRKLNFTLGIQQLERLNLDFVDSTWGASKQPATLYKLKPNTVDKDKIIAQKLYNAIQMVRENEVFSENIEVLNYKKQIILQGPPGTGKTRLAKRLAKELIKSDISLSPLEYIEWFVKNFKSDAIHKQNIHNRNLLFDQFEKKFSIPNLNKLTLDQYCLGKQSTDSFCYWIERKLKDYGRFSPGQAGTTVYGVYYDAATQTYISSKPDIAPADLFTEIVSAIEQLKTLKDYTQAKELFRYSFILKILNSYFPDEYFPIFSKKHLQYVAKLFLIDTTSLDEVEVNVKINKAFNSLKNAYSSPITNFDLMGQLYRKFKIKDNFTENQEVDVVTELGETKIIQFHPAYTYEDFVRGIVVETNEFNQPEYKVVNKVIGEFAQLALDDSAANYVLIIDEINRSNLPAVLGELIYALEYRFDPDNADATTVDSMYGIKDNNNDLHGNTSLRLPENLFIIGTMNTADRSVGHIDYAIRRRFAFVDVLPEIEPVHHLIKDTFIKISRLFVDDYNGTVAIGPLKRASTLAADFTPEDVWLGHSYFICKEADSTNDEADEVARPLLNMKLKYEVIPILKEYIKDGILNDTEEVKQVMDELISTNI